MKDRAADWFARCLPRRVKKFVTIVGTAELSVKNPMVVLNDITAYDLFKHWS